MIVEFWYSHSGATGLQLQLTCLGVSSLERDLSWLSHIRYVSSSRVAKKDYLLIIISIVSSRRLFKMSYIARPSCIIWWGALSKISTKLRRSKGLRRSPNIYKLLAPQFLAVTPLQWIQHSSMYVHIQPVKVAKIQGAGGFPKNTYISRSAWLTTGWT